MLKASDPQYHSHYNRFRRISRRRNKPGHLNTYQLALQLHDLLDIPRNSHGDPETGMKIIKAVWGSIKSALLRKEQTTIRGFGVFRPYKPRPCYYNHIFLKDRYIRANEPILLKRRTIAKFYPDQQLLALINAHEPSHSYRIRRVMAKW